MTYVHVLIIQLLSRKHRRIDMITPSIIEIFKQDLWKDQRKLEISPDRDTITKWYDTEEETNTELSVIEFLHHHNLLCVPTLHRVEDTLSARMPYYKGIRIFNLLVALDELSSVCGETADKIKKQLIDRCETQQKQIQQALSLWRHGFSSREIYPHAKILSIIEILSACLDIEINKVDIELEVSDIDAYWKTVAVVPFRDATTKNMLLHSEQLHLSTFESENERREYILKTILSDSNPEWLDSSIVNFDFSSCIHDTTPEDDVISLKYHERTWPGRVPAAENLVWQGDADGKRSAISFLVRYFRFGGRKAAYRLIHPSGHRIRFKHDDDSFYFERLPSIMKLLWSDFDTVYPNLYNFIQTAGKYLKSTRNEIDLFLGAGYGENRQNYYTDIYDPDI